MPPPAPFGWSPSPALGAGAEKEESAPERKRPAIKQRVSQDSPEAFLLAKEKDAKGYRMLTVETLKAAYGAAQVLFDVSFAIGEGEVVTLLGRNGMGKTTTISTIMGLMPPAGGRITFAGADLGGWPPYRIAQAGLGLVPEGRQIFSTLTVEENLIATAAARFGPARWQLRDVYDMFPSLAERRRNMGNQLSGGEQQMLAIGRSLMTNPKLIILDEATEGLAPLIRNEIWASLKKLKAEGLAILLVDKHIDALLKLADRHVVIEKGYVVWSGSSAALASDPSVRQRYLQV
jgi:branched-chain amino acid transport system ATP-binding protein